MDGRVEQPPWWRVLAAFLIAPAVAAAFAACLGPLYAGLPSLTVRIEKTFAFYCLFGAYPIAFIFGAPLFFCLHKVVRPTLVNCLLASAAIVSVPFGLLIALSTFAMSDESIDGHVTVSHHLPTLWGLFYRAETIGSLVTFALPGGLIFWLIALLGWKHTLPPPTDSRI